MDEIHPGARVKGIAKIYPMYRNQYLGHLEAAGRLANHLGSDPSLEVTKSDVEALSGHDVRCSCLDVVISMDVRRWVGAWCASVVGWAGGDDARTPNA